MNELAHITSADEGLRELALFAGAGGGILGGKLLGWRTVCAVEREPYAASVLIQRQNDGILPPFPIWDDVCTFDGKPWRGIVDVVSGGFPCQDISTAGKGAGLDGARSGLWGEMARIIGEVQPRYALVENSPMLTLRGLDRVLCDLAAMGFDAKWGVVSAADAGAPHLRERIWIVARNTNCHDVGAIRRLPEARDDTSRVCEKTPCKDGDSNTSNMADAKKLHSNGGHNNPGIGMGRESVPESGNCSGQTIVADPNSERQQEQHSAAVADQARQSAGGVTAGWAGSWWEVEPDVGRVADGVAARAHRLKAIGNGQVPSVVKLAWETLSGHP